MITVRSAAQTLGGTPRKRRNTIEANARWREHPTPAHPNDNNAIELSRAFTHRPATLAAEWAGQRRFESKMVNELQTPRAFVLGLIA
jgi:hypothetical protein